jgi:hypothetical protein
MIEQGGFMSALLHSRKFWIMITDVVVSLVTYFAGKYINPEAAKDILFLIGALQPAVLLVIGSIAVQNVAGIRAQSAIDQVMAYQDPIDELE